MAVRQHILYVQQGEVTLLMVEMTASYALWPLYVSTTAINEGERP